MIKNLFSGRISIGDIWVGSLVGGIVLALIATFLPPLIIYEIDFSAVLLFSAFFVFMASLIIRRLHDLNKSGWWALLSFIPGINSILWTYVGLWKGDQKQNKFGPVPIELQKNTMKRIFGLN
ncbi:MAG: DUF805 domain-containing protein [Patescibacteria group bacterium]|nr:DUF805 domain-containing protein [Patescibacteria group bacterium]MCL5095753.1 DUF805 domain-containing protein [Patescibacteria group bacterium]